MSSLAQVGYKVAGMTVGSAASVSLIGGGHEQDWELKVTRVHDADKVALCMISEPDVTKCLGLDEVVPGEIKVRPVTSIQEVMMVLYSRCL
jgi:hypothetical protein